MNDTTTLTRSLLCVATVAAAAAIAGCSSPTTRYFATEPVAPSTGIIVNSSYTGPPLQVRSVNLPPQFDRAELLREVAPGEFEIREFDHWSAPLGQMARQTLTEDLAERFPAGGVIYPDASRADPIAGVSINILSFRFQGAHAVMQVSWAVRSPTSVPSLITDGQATFETTGDDRSGAGISAAMSALLGQLSDRIASDVGAALPITR